MQSFILTSFKNMFHVSDRVRVHVYKRHNILSSLKPYQNFGSDLSPNCLLMFSVVLPPVLIHDQRDRQFQNRPWVFYEVARVVSVAMTRENIHFILKLVKLQIHHDRYAYPSLSAVCRKIIFNNEHVNWGFSRLVFKVI